MKLHQEVIYQQEREEHTMFTYIHFKLYCSLACSHLELLDGSITYGFHVCIEHGGCILFHIINLGGSKSSPKHNFNHEFRNIF